MGGKHYLDVSVVRIQDWLGRTPDLRFRRGGSILLSEATDPDAWQDNPPEGTRWNREAGSVDGVVSLMVADPDADPATVIDAAARQVVTRMRALMAHCMIQAVTGTGDSYAAAYPAMARARRDGDLLIDLPPAPAEAILAKPCDQCRAAAATEPDVPVVAGERPMDLCAECDARLDAAGRTGGRPAQAPLPERRLKDALRKQGSPVRDLAGTFTEMAAAGQRDRDDAATQVALVYADGNQVGSFLATAASIPGGPDKATIAPLLTEATLGALASAVIDRFRGWPEPPVLVNLAGGDDLLVSVPAADAWLFTKALLSTFTEILADKASAWPPQAKAGVPTLSAGLVFHHAKFPFSDAVRLAETQLKTAKAKARGQAAAAFLDLTADGAEPPPGRLPVTLAYLDEHASRLRRVADLPPSRRQTLLDLSRKDDKTPFIKRLTDFDNQPLWEIAAGRNATRPEVHAALTRDEGKLDEVRRALDIARHWQVTPRTRQEQAS